MTEEFVEKFHSNFNICIAKCLISLIIYGINNNYHKSVLWTLNAMVEQQLNQIDASSLHKKVVFYQSHLERDVCLFTPEQMSTFLEVPSELCTNTSCYMGHYGDELDRFWR